MSTSTASARRKVYVKVPQSPYPASRQIAYRLKENTSPKSMDRGALRLVNDATVLKRKLSESHITMPNSTTPAKKQKSGGPLLPQQINPAPNACPEFPNGFFSCHQCSHKFDAASSIRCITSLVRKNGEEVPCRAKYCPGCLKRHYGEDIAGFVTQVAKKGFTCPKCRNVCHCRNCRKTSNDTKTGSLCKNKRPKRKENDRSASTNQSNIEVFITKTPAMVLSGRIHSSGNDKPMAQKQARQKKLLLTPPALKWIPVPTHLELEDAKARFQIREFMLRFASLMEPTIPIVQLAELEDVGCDQSDGEEMAPWVSSACIRSMILGLLGILSKDNDGTKKPVQVAIHEIRSTGTNLNKIWSILAKMRVVMGFSTKSTRHSSQLDTVLSFPDPLPPPTSDIVYSTRATRSARESGDPITSLVVAYPAQMVPLIESLIEAACETPIVRQEIEDGMKDVKETTRQVKECIKAEKEKWDAVTKGKGKTSPEREVHKRHVQSLENALKLVLPNFAPRFVPLGTDSGGRSFWALSPGAVERKAALNFISSASGAKEVKKIRQRGHVTIDAGDYSITKEWSWFIAVWGTKIPAGPGPAKSQGKTTKSAIVVDDEEADEADVERWWGFYEPHEIKNLEKWIRIDAGVAPYGDVQMDSDKPVVSLVKGLSEYADMLAWRLKEDKYEQ